MNQQKEELIIEVAQNLFARFGFNKATVDEVAKTAHIGKSTIYYYFDTKEDIFREVIKKESRVLREKIKEAIERGKTPQEKLRAFVVTRIKYIKQLTNLYSALKEDYLEHYTFIKKERRENFEEEMETMRTILKEGADKGIFSIGDLDITSFSLVSALRGLEYLENIEIEMKDIEKNVDALLGILFNGLVTK